MQREGKVTLLRKEEKVKRNNKNETNIIDIRS